MSDTNLPPHPRMNRIRLVSRVFRLISGFIFVCLSGMAIYSLVAPLTDDAKLTVNVGTPQTAIKSKNSSKDSKKEIFEPETMTVNCEVRLGDRNQDKPKIVEKLKPEFRWTIRPLIFGHAVFWILGVGVLYRLFHLYERGIIFTTANVQCLRGIGVWALAGWALSNAIELSKLATHKSAYVYLHVNETFFAGILVLLISWIMQEASKIKEENTLTI